MVLGDHTEIWDEIKEQIKLISGNKVIRYSKNFMKIRFDKIPAEIIKEDAFGGTYFRDIYSGVNGKWCKNSWKEFDVLENIVQKYYCSDYYDVSVNKYGVKYGTSL